jgi:hypothetical protein
MSSLDYRLAVFATLCAFVGGFFFILDLAHKPLVFENGWLEVTFFAPLILYQIGRRLHLWPRNLAF